MTTILKLGGSVVTEKDQQETVDEAMLSTVLDIFADHYDPGQFVVVHGGGSFGHHHAARHGYSKTDGTRDATAVTDVHGAMTTLNEAVVDALQARGVPAVPVSPLSLAHRDAGGELSFPADTITTTLDEGFLPVVQADPIVHADRGATILSGDDIVVSLATSLGASRVGLCSTVPGVLDNDGAVIPEIESYGDVSHVLGESESTDVTGGMAGKVRTLLDLEAPAAIFDPDDLGGFLDGESVGTIVRGDR
ncbi:isopentenyl phosphate kinase [Salinibaculum salinum]|uniref:isopentenyl phosphate kinase n=1 Tax=Salinibaculum salinum TaxID=3131996 RepID=UPI0030EBFF89